MEQELDNEKKIYKCKLWSFGEKPERSFKINNTSENFINNDMNVTTNTNYSISINQFGEFRKGNNKREIVNSKLDERYSIGHIGQNPFNIENNYIKDLDVQQKFMIPKSSYDIN